MKALWWLIIGVGGVCGYAQERDGFGGASWQQPAENCISVEQRRQMEREMLLCQLLYGERYSTASGPTKYPFVPLAVNSWQDASVTNYCDLDPTNGIIDWDCTRFTYDGHQGHDYVIRSFAEQDIGVPVYAALDGMVVAAHDGEYDKNTNANHQPSNYVIIHHGGGHIAYYYHLKRDSVVVRAGEQVRAGQQIAMAGSSGHSYYPHLHFESWFQGDWYEPSTGRCHQGESGWEHQLPIRRDLYLSDFNITDALIENYPGLPYDMPRTGTFVRGWRGVSWWIILHNLPAASAWRVQFLRPDGTVGLDSGTRNWGNMEFRWSWWWWRFNVDLDVTGEWSVELSINGSVVQKAPFRVVDNAGQIVNRPPCDISAYFEPARPNPAKPLYCRVRTSLVLDDPDYEVVRYRYQWFVDGKDARDVVTAGQADCLPSYSFSVRSVVKCLVTPMDETSSGKPYTVQTPAAGSEPRKR